MTTRWVDPAFTDVTSRCPRCFKLQSVDIGEGFHGEIVAVYFCVSCGSIPQARDWESGIRAAVAAVLGRGAAS